MTKRLVIRFPWHYGVFFTIPFAVLVMISSGCSNPYEYRHPDPPEGIQNREDIEVYRVKNSSGSDGNSFDQLLSSDQIIPSETFLVTTFPRAHKKLKRGLISILEKNPPTIRIPEDLRKRVFIPFRYASENRIKWDVYESNRKMTSDTNSPDPDNRTPSGDLFISGQFRNGVVGMGRRLEEHTGKVIPRHHVYFRVETTWTYGRVRGDSKPVTIQINDDVLVNFVNHPDVISRLHLVRKTFHRLLLRVAWRVASKIIPHQYDTSHSFTRRNEKPTSE